MALCFANLGKPLAKPIGPYLVQEVASSACASAPALEVQNLQAVMQKSLGPKHLHLRWLPFSLSLCLSVSLPPSSLPALLSFFGCRCLLSASLGEALGSAPPSTGSFHTTAPPRTGSIELPGMPPLPSPSLPIPPPH